MTNLHKIATQGAVTTISSDQYVGKAGELTLDTDTGIIYFHDGTTPGGSPVGGSGGGSSVGSAGVLQMSDGSGGFLASNFVDNLSVAGSATAMLVDTVSLFAPVPGLAVLGTEIGIIQVGPISSGASLLALESYNGESGLLVYAAAGTRGAPEPVTNDTSLFGIAVSGEDGSGGTSAFSLSVRAASDFSDSPTSKIDFLNAIERGFHIDADGTFRIDEAISVGDPSGSTEAGDVNIFGIYKINGVPLGAGSAGDLPMLDGSGAFLPSDFSDHLSVPSSVTVSLVDEVSANLPAAGLQIQGTGNPVLAIGPTSTGASSLYLEGFADFELNVMSVYLATGTRDAPLPISSGLALFELAVEGETGSGGARALGLSVNSASDFSGTPTSEIHCINASSVGWHILADGTLALDTALTVGSPTGSTDAGDVNITGQFKINGTPIGAGPTGPTGPAGPGGGFSGLTTNQLPKATSGTTIGDSSFADTLSVPGSITASLVDNGFSAGPFVVPALQITGTELIIEDTFQVGCLVVQPQDVGFSIVVARAFGPEGNLFTSTLAGGTSEAPTEIAFGTTLLTLTAQAFDGTQYSTAGSIVFTSGSDFTDGITSSVVISNASGAGITILENDTVFIPNNLQLNADLITGVTIATTVASTVTGSWHHAVITVGEDLTAASDYTLTISNNRYVQSTSVFQVTLTYPGGGVPAQAAFVSGIAPGTNNATITVQLPVPLSQSMLMNISVFN